MTEYNEGARGRARYWMERAQRAEAGCERLRRHVIRMERTLKSLSRRSLEKMDREDFLRICSLSSFFEGTEDATPPPEGEPSMRALTCPGCDSRFWEANDEKRIEWMCPRCEVPLEREYDAPHTPEQTSYCPRCTQEMNRYSVTHCPSCDISVGGPPPSEQAHGDALAALNRIALIVYDEESPEPTFVGDMADEDFDIVRRHLTVSGVPYVPEEVRRLAFRCLWIAFAWNDHNFSRNPEKYAREEAEAVGITSAEEAGQFMSQIAAAPSDGGSDE